MVLNPVSAECFRIMYRRRKQVPGRWTGFPEAHPELGLLCLLDRCPCGFGWTQAAGAGNTEKLEARFSFPSCTSEGDLLSLLLPTESRSADVNSLPGGTALGPVERFLATCYRFGFWEKRQESSQYPDTDFWVFFFFLQCNFFCLDLKFYPDKVCWRRILHRVKWIGLMYTGG